MMTETNPLLNIGIIGLGGAAKQMLPSLMAHPQVRVVAAADPRAEARSAFEQHFGGRAYPDAASLCARADVDVVYIATPHQMHREHATVAARTGKHVILEKPMALTVEDCQAIIHAAEDAGICLIVGHTHSFDGGILKMREMIRNGDIGAVAMINAFSYGNFLYRPRRPEELRTEDGGGAIYNQGAHQVDIARLLGGGLVQSVSARAWSLDPARPSDGAYMAFLRFENGAAASLIYSGYDYFDSDEFNFWVGELGEPRAPGVPGAARRALRTVGGVQEEIRLKAEGGVGGSKTLPALDLAEANLPHCGVVLVTGERGDLRQSARGVLHYGQDGLREVAVNPPRAWPDKCSVIDELHDALIGRRPLVHDGYWGLATMEVCHAILRSAKDGREIVLAHQVPVRD